MSEITVDDLGIDFLGMARTALGEAETDQEFHSRGMELMACAKKRLPFIERVLTLDEVMPEPMQLTPAHRASMYLEILGLQEFLEHYGDGKGR